MKCGREPGGSNVAESGTCPASTQTHVNGINGGMNGGRLCRAIAGTFCDCEVPGSFAKEVSMCIYCDFYQKVREEEIGENSRLAHAGL